MSRDYSFLIENLKSEMSSAGVQIFNPEGYPSLALTYSHISIVPISDTKKLVSLAGQAGTDHNTSTTNPPSLGEQVRLALENVDKCLAAAGASKKDIVSARQYIVDYASLSGEDVEALFSTFLDWWKKTEGDRLCPPTTLIGLESLWSKETRYEIEVTAVADL
ncbi:hypothetical protein LTR37_010129 [Vermiconidia calcicola]|uniref:Uncharacterized protein n=1 Tax=Vermiconidia calcicola TaxID=1690605 RepID=A0ACC3N5S6_9PEZI|nr:hypothetical protein LTR37_010129 [Vermiconidia calcicola]